MSRVLVVDDEAPLRFTLRELLEERGHEVLEAADGMEALEVLRASAVDAVVTDRGWFDVVEKPDGSRGLVLREIAPGETVEGIREITGASFEVASGLATVTT